MPEIRRRDGGRGRRRLSKPLYFARQPILAPPPAGRWPDRAVRPVRATAWPSRASAGGPARRGPAAGPARQGRSGRPRRGPAAPRRAGKRPGLQGPEGAAARTTARARPGGPAGVTRGSASLRASTRHDGRAAGPRAARPTAAHPNTANKPRGDRPKPWPGTLRRGSARRYRARSRTGDRGGVGVPASFLVSSGIRWSRPGCNGPRRGRAGARAGSRGQGPPPARGFLRGWGPAPAPVFSVCQQTGRAGPSSDRLARHPSHHTGRVQGPGRLPGPGCSDTLAIGPVATARSGGGREPTRGDGGKAPVARLVGEPPGRRPDRRGLGPPPR